MTWTWLATFLWLENGLGFTLTLDGRLLRMTGPLLPFERSLWPRPYLLNPWNLGSKLRAAAGQCSGTIDHTFSFLYFAREAPHSHQHLGHYVTLMLARQHINGLLLTHKLSDISEKTQWWSRIDEQHCTLLSEHHHTLASWMLINGPQRCRMGLKWVVSIALTLLPMAQGLGPVCQSVSGPPHAWKTTNKMSST